MKNNYEEGWRGDEEVEGRKIIKPSCIYMAGSNLLIYYIYKG